MCDELSKSQELLGKCAQELYDAEQSRDEFRNKCWELQDELENATNDHAVWMARAKTLQTERDDLLAACRAAYEWTGFDGDGIHEPVRSQLIAAIAKAEARDE